MPYAVPKTMPGTLGRAHPHVMPVQLVNMGFWRAAHLSHEAVAGPVRNAYREISFCLVTTGKFSGPARIECTVSSPQEVGWQPQVVHTL